MSSALQFSKSLIVSRWPHWFYTKCMQCANVQRVGSGYASGPDVCTFDPVEQCSYYYKLLDAHAGATGRGRNSWHIRQCAKCAKIHGDWEYLSDHSFVKETLAGKAGDEAKLPKGPESTQAELRRLSRSVYAMKAIEKENAEGS